MKKYSKFISVLLILVVFTVGCNTLQKLPNNNEVLIYDKTYDSSFMGIIRAVDSLKEWDMLETDHIQGRIILINNNYGDPFDADFRQIQLNVRRLGHYKTSIQIDSGSQHVIGGDEVLKKIDYILGGYRN